MLWIKVVFFISPGQEFTEKTPRSFNESRAPSKIINQIILKKILNIRRRNIRKVKNLAVFFMLVLILLFIEFLILFIKVIRSTNIEIFLKKRD
ncbi:hypothetical protein [Methanosarcina barkeri]|uniref:hypothetical protein n=1 Tax=Methanosarcina barkeri TaxID=2208 RepID=UPI00064E8A8C|nr:hypothetical protein [Methanosarcina barkeri]